MRTILITGATSGIGLALAEQFKAQGARLILVGRKPLTALIDPLFTAETYCQADLADPDFVEAIRTFLVINAIPQIDVLIHNAGVGWMGDVWEQSEASVRELVQVNLTAPIALTHALLPAVKRAQGQIAFVSSVVTGLAVPDYAVYGATKAALDGFARSLRVEVQKDGVTVQVLHPGATRTTMHEKIGMDRAQYEKFDSAESVANKMIKAIDRPRRSATIGAGNTAIRTVGTYLPRVIDRAMAGQVDASKLILPAGSLPKHALITGAADGIGKALAETYGRHTHRITGIDNDNKRALATHTALKASGVISDFRIVDLINDNLEWVAQLDPADLIIHNAGISAVGRFADSEMADQLRVIDLNLIAPLVVTAELLRQKKMTMHSSLVFISSLSRFVGYPGAAVYSATKDGLAHYARSLRVGLASHVHVMTVYPGPTRTAHARRYSPDNSREHTRMTPNALAELIYAAQQARKRHLIPGTASQATAALGHFMPRAGDFAMRKAILDKL